MSIRAKQGQRALTRRQQRRAAPKPRTRTPGTRSTPRARFGRGYQRVGPNPEMVQSAFARALGARAGTAEMGGPAYGDLQHYGRKRARRKAYEDAHTLAGKDLPASYRRSHRDG